MYAILDYFYRESVSGVNLSFILTMFFAIALIGWRRSPSSEFDKVINRLAIGNIIQFRSFNSLNSSRYNSKSHNRKVRMEGLFFDAMHKKSSIISSSCAIAFVVVVVIMSWHLVVDKAGLFISSLYVGDYLLPLVLLLRAVVRFIIVVTIPCLLFGKIVCIVMYCWACSRHHIATYRRFYASFNPLPGHPDGLAGMRPLAEYFKSQWLFALCMAVAALVVWVVARVQLVVVMIGDDSIVSYRQIIDVVVRTSLQDVQRGSHLYRYMTYANSTLYFTCAFVVLYASVIFSILWRIDGVLNGCYENVMVDADALSRELIYLKQHPESVLCECGSECAEIPEIARNSEVINNEIRRRENYIHDLYGMPRSLFLLRHSIRRNISLAIVAIAPLLQFLLKVVR